ncbi:MAG TPA: glycosyltransferase family 2 protein [Leptolyngbyaceae cyanobacterium]
MIATPSKIPVSVLIPAKNEEANLPACLSSVAMADEVFVVDSQSKDRTVEVAESYGAKVVQFHFNGRWPKKKNWGLKNLPFRNEWVLIVDCDERITPELWAEIAEAIQNTNYNGYYLNRKVYFLGTWIKHGGRYPDWNLRLFKHEKGEYENLKTEDVPNTGDNEVHEHVILQGNVGYLKNDILHIDFRDIYQWLERHNRYSNWEARLYLNFLLGKDDLETIDDNLDPVTHFLKIIQNPVQRKRFLRKVWVWLPFKPTLRFIISYIFQLGFLDGKAGYIYARLISQYEYQIGVKLYELRKFGGQLNNAPNSVVSSQPYPLSEKK